MVSPNLSTVNSSLLETDLTKLIEAASSSTDNRLRVLTPASDYAYGWGDDAQTVWARAGNDFLSPFNPTTAGQKVKRIDRLYGDREEDVSSVTREFSDVFILGDYNIPYYVNPGNSTLQYAIIADFNPNIDFIRLHGNATNYQLKNTATGTNIFWQDPNTGELDLIGKVSNISNLDLNASYFKFIGNTPPAPSPSLSKVYQFGTTSREIPNGIATDLSGNVYVTGSTGGDLDGNGPDTYKGNLDVWVAKYNNQGELLWRHQYGSSEYDSGSNIHVDENGNVYLTGQTTGYLGDDPSGQNLGQRDYWVRKYDTNGNLIWAKQPYQTSDIATDIFNPITGEKVPVQGMVQSQLFDVAFGIDTDSAGNVYQGGLINRGASSTTRRISREVLGTGLATEDDFFLNKYDSNGNLIWRREYGTLGLFDEQYDIAVDSKANAVYAAGWTYGNLGAIDGDPEPVHELYDAWIGKFDSNNGELLWVKQFGSDEFDFTWAVELDSKGNAYAAGWTYGNIVDNSKTVVGNTNADVWIAKYNSDGEQQWIRQFGTPGDDVVEVGAFNIDPKDNLFLTGYTNSNFGGENAGSYDIWLSKYNSDGEQLWVQQFGTPQADFAYDIVSDGNFVYITGFTEGSTSIANVGATDTIIAKFDANTGELLNFNSSVAAANSLPSNSFNEILGTANADNLIGTDNADKITGLDGNDTLKGQDGDDILNGGNGNDTLTGGNGLDQFIFASGKTFKAQEMGNDKITDFTGIDQIILSKQTFTALSSSVGKGFSNADEFAVVSKDFQAATSKAKIIYSAGSGKLFYNTNGAASGLGDGGVFAQLTGAPNLSGDSIIITT
ncbi:SBBP repeat-containing protein [Gloeothece verrucosa]|uniref:Hemolysin-type calcium-binding region n=1 Tax=Gloeothece verrucosa (strain PCC 7822) TaxID=497965 RepID=E0UL74_GLOV7|nr:SBBP repeat-containing protein [Gloeothece verrucosa]ADN17704.1 hemolysin-type calcium-binding region [Gloeothece verrucosa PCC 7822]